jgi:hypothetical protein
LLVLPAVADARVAPLVQEYVRPPDGDLAQNGKGAASKRWVKRTNNKGDVFYECIYAAKNAAGQVVASQWVWYFPNDPGPDGDERSNYWVYWCNPKTDVIWGRCPTPKHPMYKAMQMEAGGDDLWQVVPPDQRASLKGVNNLREVAAKFGKPFSTKATGQPKVVPAGADAITCVDFGDPAFN